MCKYVFVTGGVISGLGKGITAAALGRLLKQRGYKVTIQKFDPYLNVDPGTMNPNQHGEVFVTDDGAQTDLDLGHYERFVDENLSQENSVTTGRIYKAVITKERNGYYCGKTVQVIPHITEEIKQNIYSLEERCPDLDVVITEIGGTVGDIESLPFLETIRQVATDKGRSNVVYIHVTLLPWTEGSKELKTKPTQHSVKSLLSIGIQPDILVCRSTHEFDAGIRDKIAASCNVRYDDVIRNCTCKSLYEVPLMLEAEQLPHAVCRHLNIPCPKPDLENWTEMVEKIYAAEKTVKILIIAKYELQDAYLSVIESLHHACFNNGAKLNFEIIQSDDENIESKILESDGVLIPGTFGERKIEGEINAVRISRENKIPYLGICMGLHVAAIEFAKNVVGIDGASTIEIQTDNDTHKELIIDYIPGHTGELENISSKTITEILRKGAYDCVLSENTLAREIYQEEFISERHRHLYEFQNNYKERLANAGLVFSGINPQTSLVEIIELPRDVHPFFFAVQFHPEFKSRPDRPHPIFNAFVKASMV